MPGEGNNNVNGKSLDVVHFGAFSFPKNPGKHVKIKTGMPDAVREGRPFHYVVNPIINNGGFSKLVDL